MGVTTRRTRRHEKSPAHDDHEELGRPVHRHVAEPSSRLAKTWFGGFAKNNSSSDRRIAWRVFLNVPRSVAGQSEVCGGSMTEHIPWYLH
jgi:hypothetical protein